MTARSVRVACLWLCAWLVAPPAVAQDSARSRLHLAELHADQVWVDAPNEAVDLFVRAVTTGGEPVVGVTPEHVQIWEDSHLVDSSKIEVTTLDESHRGVAWVLVLDTSPTMHDEVAAMKDAARAFVDRADDWDELALVQIGKAVDVTASFDTDRAQLRQAIDSLEASPEPSPTRRYDAIRTAIDLIRAADTQRRGVVVVFSDGSSDDSEQPLDAVVERAAGEAGQGQVLVYTIGYSTGFGDVGFDGMRRLAQATTARHWQPSGGEPVENFYGDIWRHVNKSYVVRFATDLDGEPHELRIAVAGKEATRSVVYPDVGAGLGRWIAGGVLALAGAASLIAWIRLRRVGRLVYKSGPEHGRAVRLRRGVNRIGQAGDNEVVIALDTVSRRHAEIEVTKSGTTLRDLDSTNGTFVNEVPVEGAHKLSPGDRVKIADVDLVYER